jgi:hypothetical protein
MQNYEAQVLIQELNDFTSLDQRPKARALVEELFQKWRGANSLVCFRMNSIEGKI